MLFLQILFFSMISLYTDLIKGNQSIKRFHLLIFLFSQIKQRRNSNRLHICTILARKSKKRSFSRNSIFSLLFFGYQSHFYMTLVSYSPHVASLLRVNISKLICDFQSWFVKSFYRFTAFSLTGKTASIALGFFCVPWTWLIKSNRKEHTVHFA